MNNETKLHDFEPLSPEIILSAVEAVTGYYLTTSIFTLPSYINRVYELKTEDGVPVIVKFYRPGRWSMDAIREEHSFVLECIAADIPVIPPLELKNGSTLATVLEFPFAVYPKKAGRELEINDEETWIRLGSLVGRMHTVGALQEGCYRTHIHPEFSLKKDIEFLLDSGLISPEFQNQFADIAWNIFTLTSPLFSGTENIRLHGDCHKGNILSRMDEGMLLIDFDDMATGPPVQDLWLLLPGHAAECRREINLILEGYENFRGFNRDTLILIEPLRAMRIIYFLAWCAKQVKDPRFHDFFPQWEHRNFWADEIRDLNHQLTVIREHIV